MKKGDLIIAIVVIIMMAFIGIGYLIYVNSMDNNRYVNIYVDRKLYKSIQLDETVDLIVEVKTEYGYNKIHIHDNGVEVLDADCPNKDDVRQGFIKMPGIPIICVPNRLKIVIEDKTSAPQNDAWT